MTHGAGTAPMDHTAHGGREHTAMDRAGMDHGGHEMGGFMSMVAMTKDLPRSRDGLPMEWVEAPFGPLFPGLPGGLGLTLTLDGDTVARARVDSGVLQRGLPATWPGPLDGFAERVARLDPLAPVAYRMLALRALEAAAGTQPGEPEARRRIGALERERAASHLSWLAQLGFLLGDRWLTERAAALGRRLRRAATVPEVVGLREEVGRCLRRIRRTPLLEHRLRDVGQLPAGLAAGVTGPVARAAGVAADTRADDPGYRGLGFRPLLGDRDDALGRLRVRLAETEQSLRLVQAAESLGPPAAPRDWPASGAGTAAVETPRGAATLTVRVADGAVVEARVDTPSARLLALVGPAAEGRELADALVGVASLDLSPWEVEP